MAGEAPIVLYALALALGVAWPPDGAPGLARPPPAVMALVAASVVVTGSAAWPLAAAWAPLGAALAALVVLAVGYTWLYRHSEEPPSRVAARALVPALAGYALVLVPLRLLSLPSAPLWWVLAAAATVGVHFLQTRRHQAMRQRADPIARGLDRGRRLLGRYEVLGPLGSGAPQRTALARDRTTDQRVVLKAMPRHGPEGILHEKELGAIQHLRHPNIVALRDHFARDGAMFLVLEHAAGGDLGARLRAGPLARDEWHRVAHGVLHGLAAAHEAGILHRDIKPGNILLRHDGTAMLADFNVARLADADRTIAIDPRDLLPLGTVRYMAPEVARGQDATIASDLWSTAATLYEAYVGEPVIAAHPDETVAEIRQRVVAFDPGTLRDDDPVLKALGRALAPVPSRRPRSATALLAAVEAAERTSPRPLPS